LRDDKPAAEVVAERVGEVPQSPAATPQRGTADPRPGAVDIRALLRDARAVSGGVEIEVDGRPLKLTNLDKVLYPQTGFTKLDVIGYYASIAPLLLPHLRGRPLTLKRYPNGVDKEFFYEKNSPRHRPDWVRTVTLPSDRGRGEIVYTLCEDVATLVWLANLADLELHPSLALAEHVDRPTTLAFDLDPGAPATVVECSEVALALRDLFDQLGLHAFAKTSGSKGLQVYVPLNVPDVSYEQTKPLARAVAALLERRHPELIVSEMAKVKRAGKVLIDWSQNDQHKTTVNVYSLRATAQPRVSTPLHWAELSACVESRDPEQLAFGPEETLSRVATQGDAFVGVLNLQQQLPALGA
jgi:bifunctional non-homologous end joining protein LigD